MLFRKKIKETKIVSAVLAVLILFVLLLGSSDGLWAGESSKRASASSTVGPFTIVGASTSGTIGQRTVNP